MGFQSIATGNDFVAAILGGGQLTVFGSNPVVKAAYDPIPNATKVFAGDDIVFVAIEGGTLTGFGSNRNQRLPIPVEIQSPVQICIAPDYVVCLQEDGRIKVWGSGISGIPLDLLQSPIASVSNSNGQFSALLANGQLVQWDSSN